MSTYDSYEAEAPRRHRSHRHHHHRDERDDPRYAETTDPYVRGPAIVDPPYVSSRQDLTLRGREDSDLSIEEVPRAFPPPGADRMVVRDDRYGPPARSRSFDRSSQYGTYLGDTRRSERDDDSRLTVEKKGKGIRRRRSLSRNQKIMAAVGGAALAVGGKELWDYRQNKTQGGERKDRNILATAAVGAAGAFAGFEGADIYTKKFADKKEKEVKEKHAIAYDRDGHAIEYYSEEEKEDKPKKSRRKSIVEGAMSFAGLGAAAKAMGGHDDDRSDRHDRSDRDDRRRRHSSEDSRGSRRTKRDGSRGRDKSPEGPAKFQQAAKAALLAGAAEAFRVRNEPGGWAGAKGKRILTAAIGAGGVGAAAAGHGDGDSHSKRHLLEAVVGGLAGNRLINGARSDDGKSSHGGGGGGRHRSRSRSAMPMAALATAGLGALAAKKHRDRSRSRSRDSRRRRSGSEDSLESGRDRRPKRSKSVTDYARKGLAALGLNDAADDRHGSSRRDRDRDMDDSRSDARSHRSSRRHRDDRDRDLDSTDDEYDRNRREDRHRDRDYDDRRSHRGSDGRNRRVAEGKQAISDSDSLGSSTDDNKRIKKMKGKQFLTAGLATVATIHAAHNVYQSMERRKAGHRAVAEGDMTPEEARKAKAKARVRTVASVGIAGLGIKGAISEWKETSAMREAYRQAQVERVERHQKRCDRAATRSNQGRSRRVSPNRLIANEPYQSSSDLSPADARDGRQRLYIDDDPYTSQAERLPRPPGYDSRDSRRR
ncbi:hypothetical protein V493_02571 [Pseudogymnoascus sp. VKM F-4281 (FW-2241)]|nr:hypothetical protein V493_02571 [Pseudogymnoascus sp. VKM F-4281 (FW-2241)]